MKKILITGAGSFIGTSFENYIKNHPESSAYEISVMDTLTGQVVESDSLNPVDNPESEGSDTLKENRDGSDGAVGPGNHKENRDESEKAAGDKWNFKGYDVIFHVAGIAHADVGKVSEEGRELYRKVNTLLTIDVAEKAKAAGVKQFIFMSSSIVYGASSKIGEKKEITKDTDPNPENFYGDSKLNAEKGLRDISSDDFKIVILRPPMIYGPGCKGNYNSLRKFALKLPLFPKVENERSMLYIDNLCEFVRLMIDNEESGIFHPANAEDSNTSEMVRMIAEAHGKKLSLIGGFTWLLKIMSHFTGMVNKAFGSMTYSKDLTTYKENYRIYSLEESIRETEK